MCPFQDSDAEFEEMLKVKADKNEVEFVRDERPVSFKNSAWDSPSSIFIVQ